MYTDAMRPQQTSRSSNQLYRYNHETVSTALLRRDLPPVIIICLFLFLIIIILSQILVVHTSRYGSKYASMQKIQEELKQMDQSMNTILRDNVLPIDKWRLLLHIQTYVDHFQYLYRLFKQEIQSSIEQRNGNSSDKNFQGKNLCSEQPSQLRMFEWEFLRVFLRRRLLEGRIFQSNSTFANVTLEEIEANYSSIRSGGHWSPSHCLARHRVRTARMSFLFLLMMIF